MLWNLKIQKSIIVLRMLGRTDTIVGLKVSFRVKERALRRELVR